MCACFIHHENFVALFKIKIPSTFVLILGRFKAGRAARDERAGRGAADERKESTEIQTHIIEKNTDVVLDVELLHGKLIKDFAICTPFFVLSFVFRPPHLFDECTDLEKRQNIWLTRN